MTNLSERYGLHRVLSPAGVLPQAAFNLDPQTGSVWPSELVLEVERLHVDSASFRQLDEAAKGDERAIAEAVARIVRERGKLHNPVTGSGGMLLGRVSSKSGPLALEQFGIAPGQKVATLVSLTLTPLALAQIGAVRRPTHEIEVEGEAIVFASGGIARVPDDLPERLVLGALDVAGAAPHVERLIQRLVDRLEGRPGPLSCLILGCGGKSGLICAAAAKLSGARVVGVEAVEPAAVRARRLGAFSEVHLADARDPIELLDRTGGGFDLVISCVNVDHTEMAAILAAREGGTIYFFSMATSFARAALGAEGISRDVTMLIGTGYCPGHVDRTLNLLRSDPVLRGILEEQYAG